MSRSLFLRTPILLIEHLASIFFEIFSFRRVSPLPALARMNIGISRMSDIPAILLQHRQRESTMILPFLTLVILSMLGLSCVVAPFVGTAAKTK